MAGELNEYVGTPGNDSLLLLLCFYLSRLLVFISHLVLFIILYIYEKFHLLICDFASMASSMARKKP